MAQIDGGIQRAPPVTTQDVERTLLSSNQVFVLWDILAAVLDMRADREGEIADRDHMKAFRYAALVESQTLVDPLLGRGADGVPIYVPDGISINDCTSLSSSLLSSLSLSY